MSDDLPNVGGMNVCNDGDEFVWEEEEPPPSDHTSSHHYFLDLAAMRARERYGERRTRIRRLQAEPEEAA